MANPLKKSLLDLVKTVEQSAQQSGHGSFAQKLHLMPPTGWLNDPNGLHQSQGRFVAYFQYSPFDVEGGLKFWGKSSSQDLIHWTYEGCALVPDSPYDLHGVYSGSALSLPDGSLDLFYTGNVKLEDDPSYDYIQRGRGSYTLKVHLEPGDTLEESRKELVFGPDDYPEGLSQHIRDPKVWLAEDGYHLLLGARDLQARGLALHYVSPDNQNWQLQSKIESSEPFGYMWECPDYLAELGILSVSPQGLRGGAWDRRNVYQSGFFPADVNDHQVRSDEFKLWDAGFDFYAPQSFLSEDGRRIMIGWMGMPDEPKHQNLEATKGGWQHCLTIARELYLGPAGQVAQRPVRELNELRSNKTELVPGKTQIVPETFDLELSVDGAQTLPDFSLSIGSALKLSYENASFSMEFIDASASGGREKRFEPLDSINAVRIIKDVSSVEVFFEDMSLSFSTRYYGTQNCLELEAEGLSATLWELS